MSELMRLGYQLLLYLIFPWVLLWLAIKGLRVPGYRKRIAERFGFSGPDCSPGAIWIHAVSVGEVNAAVPLINRLLARWPERTVILTTMTVTGSERVRTVLGDLVFHCYLPYDYPGAVNRFLQRFQPALGLVMETEIWPNLVVACHRSDIPLIYANVRMSEKSRRGYSRFKPLVADTLAKVTWFAVQSESDLVRLEDLGAPPDKMRLTGNMKFDVEIPASVSEAGDAIRRRLGRSRSVLLAASTHDGEEVIMLHLFQNLLARIPGLLLVLAPRHPERFPAVARLCEKKQYPPTLISHFNGNLDQSAQVVLLDRMGELPKYIAACDIVLMGGSLVPVGGHNLLEAAALKRPVVFGPHMFNFAEIASMFLAQSAGVQVNDETELVDVVHRLLIDARMRDECGRRGRRLMEQNKGAVEEVEALVVNELIRERTEQSMPVSQ